MATNDFAFYRIRHYVGSGDERVEVRPARELVRMGGRRWAYRFPNDRRWRFSPDKFWALLEAAWELGKSGADMDWTPHKKMHNPRRGFIAIALERCNKDHAE